MHVDSVLIISTIKLLQPCVLITIKFIKPIAWLHVHMGVHVHVQNANWTIVWYTPCTCTCVTFTYTRNMYSVHFTCIQCTHATCIQLHTRCTHMLCILSVYFIFKSMYMYVHVCADRTSMHRGLLMRIGDMAPAMRCVKCRHLTCRWMCYVSGGAYMYDINVHSQSFFVMYMYTYMYMIDWMLVLPGVLGKMHLMLILVSVAACVI